MRKQDDDQKSGVMKLQEMDASPTLEDIAESYRKAKESESWPVRFSHQNMSRAMAETHREIFRQEYLCHPSHRTFEVGAEIDIIAEDGANIGKAKMEGDGYFVVVDKWNDVRINKLFWFLAGQFDGDPTVAYGKVVRFQHEHCREWLNPRTKLWIRLENGHEAMCYDTDLHPSKEAAEKARALQLQEEQEDE